jgi:hypothetical protein
VRPERELRVFVNARDRLASVSLTGRTTRQNACITGASRRRAFACAPGTSAPARRTVEQPLAVAAVAASKPIIRRRLMGTNAPMDYRASLVSAGAGPSIALPTA